MTDFAEKRTAERFPVKPPTTCDFASPVLEDFGPVKIRNVSTDGIGLVVSQQLAAGMMMAINIANPAKKFSKTMLARIVHVTPQPGGTALVGCTFVTPLSYEELCLLVM
jgi:hypothetical protein